MLAPFEIAALSSMPTTLLKCSMIWRAASSVCRPGRAEL